MPGGYPDLDKRFHVFTDESGLNADARFMLIGGLWVPETRLLQIRREVEQILAHHGIRRQIHWSKLESRKLAGYRALIDLLVTSGQLQFNCIVIEKSEVDWQRYHSNSFDLAFNKFYFLLLSRRIERGCTCWISISERSTSLKTPFQDIRLTVNRWCSRACPSMPFPPVAQIKAAPNSTDRLLQFADLILGDLV